MIYAAEMLSTDCHGSIFIGQIYDNGWCGAEELSNTGGLMGWEAGRERNLYVLGTIPTHDL